LLPGRPPSTGPGPSRDRTATPHPHLARRNQHTDRLPRSRTTRRHLSTRRPTRRPRADAHPARHAHRRKPPVKPKRQPEPARRSTGSRIPEHQHLHHPTSQHKTNKRSHPRNRCLRAGSTWPEVGWSRGGLGVAEAPEELGAKREVGAVGAGDDGDGAITVRPHAVSGILRIRIARGQGDYRVIKVG